MPSVFQKIMLAAIALGGLLMPIDRAIAGDAAVAAVGAAGFPRISTLQYVGDGVPSKGARYTTITGGANDIADVADVKAYASSQGRSITAIRYFSPRAYQGDVRGIRAADTYPGHWLFAAGTNTTSALGATETTIPVADATRFSGLTGHFAMIWDGTARVPTATPSSTAFWAGSEHVKVVSVGATSITVQRGYAPPSMGTGFEAARRIAHPAGSRIAVHVPGAYTPPENLAYNMSTSSPPDAAGRTMPQAMAAWLGLHLQEYFNTFQDKYVAFPGAWDGVLFDADVYWINKQPPSDRADVNNDQVADGGVLLPGRSAWGEGLDQFYASTRSTLGPSKLVVGGTMETRGGAYLNGTEFEGFPGLAHSSNNYAVYSAGLSRLQRWMADAGATPKYSHVYTRIGTNVHAACVSPGNQATAQGTNADFRFGLGTALLAGADFAYTNGCINSDFWWDEYAVDLVGGWAAPLSSGDAYVGARTGYLGLPVAPAQRLVDTTQSGANLLTGGSWGVQLAGGAAATAVTAGTQVTANITAPGSKPEDVILHYKPISLTGGQEYTLSFLARSDHARSSIDLGRDVDIWVNTGTGWTRSGKIIVGAGWERHVISFVAASTSTAAKVQFKLGGEQGGLSLDQVRLSPGGSDVLRRDFENGIVLVNGRTAPQTVDLGATFRRIHGTQDPTVNNGATVSTVTLGPRDAIILLRKEHNVTWGAHTTPATMAAGSTNSVTVGFTNTGYHTWLPDGTTPVRASYHWKPSGCGGSAVIFEGIRSPIPTTVSPGESVSGAPVTVLAPTTPGTYCLEYDLVRNSVTWFSAQAAPTLSVTVVVGGTTPPPTSTATATATSTATATPPSVPTATPTAPLSAADLRTLTLQTPPASAVAGTQITLGDEATNSGTLTAASSRTYYYLSTDTVRNANDVRAWGFRTVPVLASGASHAGTTGVKIPASLAPGFYFVIACADGASVVTEASESNNCRYSTTRITVSAP